MNAVQVWLTILRKWLAFRHRSREKDSSQQTKNLSLLEDFIDALLRSFVSTSCWPPAFAGTSEALENSQRNDWFENRAALDHRIHTPKAFGANAPTHLVEFKSCLRKVHATIHCQKHASTTRRTPQYEGRGRRPSPWQPGNHGYQGGGELPGSFAISSIAHPRRQSPRCSSHPVCPRWPPRADPANRD